MNEWNAVSVAVTVYMVGVLVTMEVYLRHLGPLRGDEAVRKLVRVLRFSLAWPVAVPAWMVRRATKGGK